MRMRNVIWPVILAATLFLSSCNREEKEDAWQQRIRQVSELGTVQYTVQKVVSNSDETWQIFGNRKILFSFKAIIKAGIDMDKFDAESVRISVDKNHKTKSISLVLPQPEVLSYNICPDDVKMIYNQVSFLRTEYSNEERNAIQRKGEMELKEDKELTDMILKDARQNAAMFMEMLLHENGFTNVNISFKQEGQRRTAVGNKNTKTIV
ncbi:MAG: DUF4230 domain-containing protein [Bacteroidales bacterium]|nr:DUF4230 domain-containing protein [Bacteroidales bacterium]